MEWLNTLDQVLDATLDRAASLARSAGGENDNDENAQEEGEFSEEEERSLLSFLDEEEEEDSEDDNDDDLSLSEEERPLDSLDLDVEEEMMTSSSLDDYWGNGNLSPLASNTRNLFHFSKPRTSTTQDGNVSNNNHNGNNATTGTSRASLSTFKFPGMIVPIARAQHDDDSSDEDYDDDEEEEIEEGYFVESHSKDSTRKNSDNDLIGGQDTTTMESEHVDDNLLLEQVNHDMPILQQKETPLLETSSSQLQPQINQQQFPYYTNSYNQSSQSNPPTLPTTNYHNIKVPSELIYPQEGTSTHNVKMLPPPPPPPPPLEPESVRMPRLALPPPPPPPLSIPQQLTSKTDEIQRALPTPSPPLPPPPPLYMKSDEISESMNTPKTEQEEPIKNESQNNNDENDQTDKNTMTSTSEIPSIVNADGENSISPLTLISAAAAAAATTTDDLTASTAKGTQSMIQPSPLIEHDQIIEPEMEDENDNQAEIPPSKHELDELDVEAHQEEFTGLETFRAINNDNEEKALNASEKNENITMKTNNDDNNNNNQSLETNNNGEPTDDSSPSKVDYDDEVPASPKQMEVHAFQAAMGDFLLTETFGGNQVDSDDEEEGDDLDDESIESAISESIVDESEDYKIPETILPWDNDSELPYDVDGQKKYTQVSFAEPTPTPVEMSINRAGVVHVRLLRAQNLKCKAGSGLQAFFSLPPWKGRIKSSKVTSYEGPKEAGICARWDKVDDNAQSSSTDKKEHVMTTPDCHSMVHVYNNEDTPIPSIKIELKDLAYQMFEIELCALTLSCEPLMRNPGEFKQQWCYADTSRNSPKTKRNRKNSDQEQAEDENETKPPLILLEACFEPTHLFDRSQSTKAVVGDALIDPNGVTSPESKKLKDQLNGDISNSSVLDLVPENAMIASPLVKRLSSRPHMFRIVTTWKPTFCAVCNSMITFMLKGYQCEVCNVVCCSDCQLNVDVELPCGSEAAKLAVKNASEPRINMGKLMTMVAPLKANFVSSKEGKDTDIVLKDTVEDKIDEDVSEDVKEPASETKLEDGVGTLKLRILKACLFERHFPPEAELNVILKQSDRWLRHGDHYARVSWTGSQETKRTRTVFQSPKPRFDSDQMAIRSNHYGTEFRIEILDAATDRPVGCSLLSTQGLLHWQRCELEAEGGISFNSIISQKPMPNKKRRVIVELRTGVKNGFGLDFYNAGKPSDGRRAGEITGWVELEMCFEEEALLYSDKNPIVCPQRPQDEFNRDLIQLHISRINSLVEDIGSVFNAYMYMISWKNPALTSLSLLMFAILCFKFNAEYFGSLPVAMLICYMLYCAFVKKSGGFRSQLIFKERDTRIKEEKGTSVKYDRHRPCAHIEVSVLKGLHLSTGIPGSFVTNVLWDPLRFAGEKAKAQMIQDDAALKGIHHMGSTDMSGVTFSPTWESMIESDDLKGLKNLLPSSNFLSNLEHNSSLNSDIGNKSQEEKNEGGKNLLRFPILHPITVGQDTVLDGDETEEQISIELSSWNSSRGGVVFQVHFDDVLNRLPLFDDTVGEVVIPFERIVREKEIQGWFQVVERGTNESIEIQPGDVDEKSGSSTGNEASAQNVDNSTKAHSVGDKLEESKDKASGDKPMIFLKIKIQFPDEQFTEIDRETSLVVAKEMIRSAESVKKSNVGIIGSSISTVKGGFGNVLYLQNQLGDILNIVEMLRNILNFSCPEKSAFVLICLVALWFLLVLLPTRVLIFFGGLGQYITTFMAYKSKPGDMGDNQKDHIVKEAGEEAPHPLATRVLNFFYSIPTNEDLRRYYFWEARRFCEREREILANKKRAARLVKLWNAEWYGVLELKVSLTSMTRENERGWDWVRIFGVIQGHRFVWWNNEREFDNGENPLGQIVFSGHSGLAGLSPLELRELKKNEIPTVVNIFGRGVRGQQKLSLLIQDVPTKEQFESAVLRACSDPKHD